MAKGMSGVSGGVMGYQALNSEFERIQAKLTAGSGVVPGGISRPVAAPVEEPAPAALVGQPVATRRPVVAGVFSILAGVVGLIIGLTWISSQAGISDVGEVLAIFWPAAVVAIIGGIFALRRRLWGLVLAGAICSLTVFPLGIPALILAVLSRREFK
jgi:hypothetical protein